MQNNNLSICISEPLCHIISQWFDMEADVPWKHQRNIDSHRISQRSEGERIVSKSGLQNLDNAFSLPAECRQCQGLEHK